MPLHLRNAPTALSRELGYGEGYDYPHDQPDAFVARANRPDSVPNEAWYQPTQRGAEKAMADQLAQWRARRDRESKG